VRGFNVIVAYPASFCDLINRDEMEKLVVPVHFSTAQKRTAVIGRQKVDFLILDLKS
jgi:hypothetical protein